MAFDWREYLALAEALASHADERYSEEAAHRAAVSRAYYAAFGHARRHASSRLGFRPTGTPRDHVLLRRHFALRRRAAVAHRLDRLRKWRNLCDYDDRVANLALLSAAALQAARRVVDALT